MTTYIYRKDIDKTLYTKYTNVTNAMNDNCAKYTNRDNIPEEEYNKKLYEKFPFIKDDDEIDFSFTILDMIPVGWKIGFGEELLADIAAVLEKENITDYHISEMKEKYGGLDIYGWPYNEELEKLYRKYREISEHYCIVCGSNKALMRTEGYWIYPACSKCVKLIGEQR